MADTHNLSTDALVRKVLTDDHADLVREAVSFLCHQIMEAEVSAQIGAGLGERAPAERTAHRNGYRERRFDTRAGSLELFIPKLRSGSYFPSFLEPRTRAEQALVAVVMESYVNGVSTRKVERVVEQLGIAGMTKSAVSRMCAALDEQVVAFRERPLEGRLPVPVARRQGREGPRSRWPRAPQGPGGRLRGPRGRLPRGDRPRCRGHRVGGLLARVPALAGGARPAGRRAGRLRCPRGPQGGHRPDPRLSLAALHRPLPARDARPRAPRPAGDDRRRAAPGLPGRVEARTRGGSAAR